VPAITVTVSYNTALYNIYKQNLEKTRIIKFDTTTGIGKVNPLKRIYFHHRENGIITHIMYL